MTASLSSLLVQTVLLGLATCVAWKLWTLWLDRRRRVGVWSKLPNCPGEDWLSGHILAIARAESPCREMIRWLSEKKEPIARVRFGTQLMCLVEDPRALRRMMQTHVKAYPKDVDFGYGPFLSILGKGIITTHGPDWQKRRLILSPALKMDLMDSVIPVARKAIKRMSVNLEAVRGTQQTVDLSCELRHLTLQVIAVAIMSLEAEECDKVLATTYLPVMEECYNRAFMPWRKYIPNKTWFQHKMRLIKLNNFLKNKLHRRWETVDPETAGSGDLLDRLMGPLKAQSEKLSAADADQICDELKTLLLAGHETSASMMTWALYELLINPKCFAKVRAESDALFGDGDRLPTREEVEALTYTLAVLKETLRKYSIVPVVSRKAALENDELCGYAIPKGTTIVISIKGVHDQYKNPEVFNPDRFLPGGEYDSFDEEIRPFMFVPFVQGPRICVGQYFSLLESRYVLCHLIKYYKFSLASDEPVLPGPIIPEAPKDGLNLLVQ